MSCLSVVRIGPISENVSGSMLRNSLLDHFARKNGGESAEPTHRVTCSNRYFTAEVLLQDIGGTNQEADLPLAEDGIILVFDAAKSNPDFPVSMTASFDSLDSVHDQVVQEGAGDLLRLCVGVTIGKYDASEIRGKDHEEEYSRRILWCLDRGYEYVEADLSEEGLGTGHDERDKEGFARIVEAIGGTVWSSAVMGSSKKKQLEQSFAETRDQHGDAADEYVPPDPSMLTPPGIAKGESDEVREAKAREALLSQATGDFLDEFQENIDPETASQRAQEREQERALDSFESAMRQAARIREMSRSGSLSDEERRARAGEAAVLIMDLMGKLGADDENEEDSDVSAEGETAPSHGDNSQDASGPDLP